MAAPHLHLVSFALALALVGSCSPAGGSPASIADAFWRAVRARDWSTAKGLSTAADPLSLESVAGSPPLESYTIGETLHADDRARVETSLHLSDGEADVVFHTHLIRFEEGWRVDVAQTRLEIARAHVDRAVAEVETAIREGSRALGLALEEGAREASKALRRALEDAERALEHGPPPTP